MGSPSLEAAKVRNPAMFASPERTIVNETAVMQICVTLPCSAAVLQDALTAVQGNTGDPSEISVEGVTGYDANHLRENVQGLQITRNVTALVGNSEGLTVGDL